MTKIPKNSLILIDGSSYLYRAYYVFPSLVNKNGEPSGAIYGVLNMIRSLILQYHPTHIIVIFDTNKKTFRNELFEYYKSNRPTMPNNLRLQIKMLYRIIKVMGLQIMAIPGIEADDIIGTLARKAEKIGYSVLISTSDKDMAQLVTSRINLIHTTTKTIIGPKEVTEKYGVPPELIIDFLSLVGDLSDNIPGIPGIGKKSAQTLLKKFGKLDVLYTQIDKISKSTFRGAKILATKLEQHKKIAYLSYQLATIKTNVELNITFDQLVPKKPKLDELLSLFKKYEFKRWIAEVETGRWMERR